MPNSIALITKYQAILDELYKIGSLTSRMDAPTKPVNFAGANVVKVMKTSVVGLGNYSRASGYPKGDVTVTWETLTLAQERARELSIDRMDDEETAGMAFGTLAGEFMRTKVVPEVDAFRFATYAGWSGISAAAAATLAASTILPALDAAILQMDEDEVPPDGRLLYLSSTCAGYLNAAVSRSLGNESAVNTVIKDYNGIAVIPVPQTRFYTIIDLDSGSSSSSGGFTKNGSGKDINFLLIHPSAVLQATKLADLKMFPAAVNQSKDADMIQYRLYHDAFVYDNKVDGVYLHKKA
jgi:hypothetical protein